MVFFLFFFVNVLGTENMLRNCAVLKAKGSLNWTTRHAIVDPWAKCVL